MILSCSRGAESLFTVRDFADYIAASADGQYIVGLSNRGSENAFWIRDAHGKVIEQKTHGSGPHHWSGIHYCQESVTNVREWFDKADPAVRFQLVDGKLTQVLVRSCDGKRPSSAEVNRARESATESQCPRGSPKVMMWSGRIR